MLVVTSLVVAVCVYWSWRRLDSVRRLADPSTEAIVQRLRAPRSLEGALRSARGRTRTFISAGAQAKSREDAVAELNLLLIEVDADLVALGEVPRGAARIALLAGALAGVLYLATGVSRDSVGAAARALPAVALGAVGAALCGQLGRRADRMAQRQRRAYDALARAVAARVQSGGDGLRVGRGVGPGPHRGA